MVLKGVDDFLLKECMSFDDDTFPPVFSFFHCCLKKVQNKTGSHYKATQVGILPPNFWLENSSFTAFTDAVSSVPVPLSRRYHD